MELGSRTLGAGRCGPREPANDIPQTLRLDRGKSASSLALAAQDKVGSNSSWRK